MDWHDLAYFICLVEQQTLTACAEQLDVQHSTVSRRIARLEQALSLTLFERLGKRYILTQEGMLLYAQATEVQKEITTFKRMAVDHNAMQGSVVVSAPPVLANEVLIAELPAFRKRYPDIVLHLRGDVHFSDLYRKEADIALRLSRPIQEDLLIRTISHIKYGFFAHRDYIERTPAKQWQLIEFQANARLLIWLQDLIQHHHYSIVFSSNDLYVTYSSVCQQVGIAILPYFLAAKNSALLPVNPINRTVIAEHEIVSDEKHSNQDEQTIPLIQSQPLYVVMHPDVRQSARVSAVAEWLGEVFSR